MAIVELEGIIVDVDDVVRELKAHRENPIVRAVVMRINSPGGVVAPTQELHDAVLRLRQAGKPVVASLGAVAASGGYYVAVAADQIYANPGTLTGSIGVIMQLANFEQLMKKVGVDYVVVKAGQFKDIGNVGAPMTPRGAPRAAGAARRRARPVHRRRRRRPQARPREEVVRFADGRVFSGTQAKDLKMVDALGGLEDAVDRAPAKLAGLPVAARPSSSRRRKFSIMDLLRNQFGPRGACRRAARVQDAALPDGLITCPTFKTPLVSCRWH